MKNAQVTKGDSFSDEVKINFYVLGALMLNRVGRHVEGIDFVTIDKGAVPGGECNS